MYIKEQSEIFLNKKLSNYRPVTSASWGRVSTFLIPNGHRGAGRWIPQLTKQLVRPTEPAEDKGCPLKTMKVLCNTLHFLAYSTARWVFFFFFFFFRFHFLSLDEAGGDSQLQFKRRGELTPANDVHMGCDLLWIKNRKGGGRRPTDLPAFCRWWRSPKSIVIN